MSTVIENDLDNLEKEYKNLKKEHLRLNDLVIQLLKKRAVDFLAENATEYKAVVMEKGKNQSEPYCIQNYLISNNGYNVEISDIKDQNFVDFVYKCSGLMGDLRGDNIIVEGVHLFLVPNKPRTSYPSYLDKADFWERHSKKGVTVI